MQLLSDAGLFGAGLLPVNTEVLVQRYNDCLQELGLDPTSLSKFNIDGMGWSPEIAAEKGDVHYLSAGLPNQLAIIITPNQRNKPVYFPFHSYDRQLMDSYFNRSIKEIADITASRGIALDIDQELTKYESVRDLCLVNYVMVRTYSGGLGDLAREQKRLIEQLMLSPSAWRDADFRQKICQTSIPYGDLRHRRVEIEDFRFSDIGSFYTRAFGGVFVLKHFREEKRLLLIEDQSLAADCCDQRAAFPVYDPATVNRLCQEGFLDLNLKWYQAYPQVLVYLKDCLAAEILCQKYADLDFYQLNPPQKRQLMLDTKGDAGDVYYELERFMKFLQGTTTPSGTTLSAELKQLLLRPNRNLPLSEQLVLRQFLHRLNQSDIVQLYADDKNFFFEQYRHWSNSKQRWAVAKITQDYILADTAPEGT